MANIPSGNPMGLANASANPYPSMPSQMGEWGNNLRRFTVILHSETTGSDFGGGDYSWTNHQVPNAGCVRFPLQLCEYINAPRAKLIPELLCLNFAGTDGTKLTPVELAYAAAPVPPGVLTPPYCTPTHIMPATSVYVRCPQAVQRNTYENCQPLKGYLAKWASTPTIAAPFNSQALGYDKTGQEGGPTNVIMMCPMASKVEDSMEHNGPAVENRAGWTWKWEQQFNKDDNGAEIDSSFWNNGFIDLMLTDDIGRPFCMFDVLQTAGNSTNIQYTFKFSIVYESEEE